MHLGRARVKNVGASGAHARLHQTLQGSAAPCPPDAVARASPPPPLPSRTNWTGLVPRPVLTGHISADRARGRGSTTRAGARAAHRAPPGMRRGQGARLPPSVLRRARRQKAVARRPPPRRQPQLRRARRGGPGRSRSTRAGPRRRRRKADGQWRRARTRGPSPTSSRHRRPPCSVPWGGAAGLRLGPGRGAAGVLCSLFFERARPPPP